MSSRRSTRGASRPNQGSPAPSETLRRSTRNSGSLFGTPLPHINTRETTSYGSGMAVLPKRLGNRHENTDLSSALADIVRVSGEGNNLTPHRTDSRVDSEIASQSAASSSRAGRIRPKPRSKIPPSSPNTPGNDNSKSFFNESGLYGESTFNQGGGTIDEDEEEEETPNIIQNQLSRAAINANRNRAQQARAGAQARQWFHNLEFEYWTGLMSGALSSGLNMFKGTRSYICMAFLAISIFGLMTGLFGNTRFDDVKTVVGGLIPAPVRHPMMYFNEHDVYELQKRVDILEYELKQAQRRKRIDETLWTRLDKMLPDFVIFQRGKNGEKVIPVDFWRALKAQIKEELPLLQENFFTRSDSETGISSAELDANQVRHIAGSAWTNFLDSNEAKIKAWVREDYDDLWHQSLGLAVANEELIRKVDLIAMIEDNFERSQKLSSAEVSKIMKQIARGSFVPNTTLSITENQLKILTKDVSKDVFKRIYSDLQLEQVAKKQIKQHTDYSLQRLNHFSPGVGAKIDPFRTSPTFSSSTRHFDLFSRTFLWMIGDPLPVPNHPVAALSRWDEQGDCWCSPADGSGSGGAQLGVITKESIYPDEFVLEHIPHQATLDPQATPREVELLAYGGTWKNFDKVSAAANTIFAGSSSEFGIENGWVRLGKWIYEPKPDEYIQPFIPQLDLRKFGVKANHFVFRAVSNWSESGKEGYTCIYRVRVHGDTSD